MRKQWLWVVVVEETEVDFLQRRWNFPTCEMEESGPGRGTAGTFYATTGFMLGQQG